MNTSPKRSVDSEWSGHNLKEATGRKATRSYVANPKKGRIEKNPGLAKLESAAGR